METTPREQILKRVRQAVMEKTKNPYTHIDLDSNVFSLSGDDPVVDFANQFTKLGGQFLYCANKFDCIDMLLRLSEDKLWNKFYCKEAPLLKMMADTGFTFVQTAIEIPQTDALITGCEGLLYRSGSLVVSNFKQPRRAIVTSPIHIFIAYTSQLQKDLKDVFSHLKTLNNQKLPRWVSVITGPSRSVDIEKTMVTGAQGAREVYCFLIEDRQPEDLQRLMES